MFNFNNNLVKVKPEKENKKYNCKICDNLNIRKEEKQDIKKTTFEKYTSKNLNAYI